MIDRRTMIDVLIELTGATIITYIEWGLHVALEWKFMRKHNRINLNLCAGFIAPPT